MIIDGDKCLCKKRGRERGSLGEVEREKERERVTEVIKKKK